MTRYAPPPFDGQNHAAALELMATHPFASLITSLGDAEPFITPMPLLYADGALWGHLARANPQAALFDLGQTVAVFHGPHAYVSPRWYETPERHVPTWNYAVVHVAGRPELLNERETRRFVVELTAHFDPGWMVDDRVLGRLLPAIVAFRMPILRLDATFKISQNRTMADRSGVRAALAASASNTDRALAEWMRRHE